MLILALAIVPLLVIPLVVDLSPTSETILYACDWFIWTAFAVEYGVGRHRRSLDLETVDPPGGSGLASP